MQKDSGQSFGDRCAAVFFGALVGAAFGLLLALIALFVRGVFTKAIIGYSAAIFAVAGGLLGEGFANLLIAAAHFTWGLIAGYFGAPEASGYEQSEGLGKAGLAIGLCVGVVLCIWSMC